MAARKPTTRAGRRARGREQQRLVRDQERLAALEPGGAPERPLVVESAAQVEPKATAAPCPLCDGTVRLEAHEAESIGGDLLRVARVACTSCGVRRRRWFRLAAPLLN